MQLEQNKHNATAITDKLAQGKVISWHHLSNGEPMNPWHIFIDSENPINLDLRRWGKNFYVRYRGFITPNVNGEHRLIISTPSTENFNFTISKKAIDSRINVPQ